MCGLFVFNEGVVTITKSAIKLSFLCLLNFNIFEKLR